MLKRDSPDPVVAGTTSSVHTDRRESRTVPASDVTLTDVLPTGVTVISAASTLGTCTGTTTITCQMGRCPGRHRPIGILATAPLDVPAPNPMVNSVSVTSSGPVDPNPANNTATEPTTVLARSRISLTKTLTTAAIPGLTRWLHDGRHEQRPERSDRRERDGRVPAAFTTASWTCTADAGSACGTTSGTGNIATTVDLESGDTATFTVDRLDRILRRRRTEQYRHHRCADRRDRSESRQQLRLMSSVTLTPSADLQITKSGPAQATAGGTLTYAITVTNAGPSDAVAVTLADPTPTGLTFVSGGGSCASYPCALGTIPAGGTIVANPAVTFAIPPGYTTPDPIVNTATVSSATTPDPATGNNSATAMSAIAAPVTDLGITKTNGIATVVPGSTTTYTITVTNAGPSNASGATVTDVFPAALTGVTWTCAGAGGGIAACCRQRQHQHNRQRRR